MSNPTNDQWAVAALGTLIVIVAAKDHNNKEDICAALEVLVDNAPEDLTTEAILTSIQAVAEIQAEREAQENLNLLEEE